MNRLVDPQSTEITSTAMPGGFRGLVLRAQTSPLGFRLMTAHYALLKKAGAMGYSFIVCVALPTLAGFLYLALWASYEYESEARFTVRSANETSPGALVGALSAFSALGIGKASTQDAFVVADYIRSRTIIEDLGGKPLLHELYSKPGIDFFSRLSGDASLEDVWKYWNRKVSAVINTQSDIVTVKAHAYSEQEAHRLTELIVQQSEALVNEISERSRNDALKRADSEVQAAMKRVSLARQNMLEFRNKSSVINPITSASSIATTLTQLMRDKLTLESSRGSLSDVMDKNSPTQRILQTQIDTLDKQIAQLQERLTSQQSDNVIAGQISNFEELQLESQFAEKLLSISQSAYEKARMEQNRQQLYLVAIVRPTVPEKAAYPHLSTAIPMIFVVCLVLWGMVALILASIKDHLG